MAAVPIPVRASLRDLLGDLVGRKVAVGKADVQQLSTDHPSYLAAYRRDDGRLAALSVCDQATAIALGAAIGMMPAAEASAEVEAKGKLDGDLWEFFHEVVNVMAKLLNSPTTPHVVLREVVPVPGNVSGDIATLARGPSERVDYTVDVEGFTPGTLTLLA